MIVGTAGHIDHGKTTLVRALTGVDTDRLKEEKARGISIELGYAYVPLDNGEVLGFVDVPGHERLVHTMTAGASGIDFGLLVVAADDGVMPQTVEHLAILSFLGIRQGAVAITKIDKADSRRLQQVRDEIAGALEGSFLAGMPVFGVDAAGVSQQGVTALRAYLHEQAKAWAGRPTEGLFRLAVDRAFTLSGHGTVVTGTAHGGSVRLGDTHARLRLMPEGREVRLRGLHAQNRASDSGTAGQRCALNLAGIDKNAIERGAWIADERCFLPSRHVDVALRLLPTAEGPLRPWQPLHVHLGAAHHVAHVVPLDADVLSPGGHGRVQLVFDEPVCAMSGDRFIVRNAQASRTVGGGQVLDPNAPDSKRRSAVRKAWLDALSRVIDGAGIEVLLEQAPQGLDESVLMRITGQEARNITIPDDALWMGTRSASAPRTLILRQHWAALALRVLDVLGAFHVASPDEPGVESSRLRRMALPAMPEPMWQVLRDHLLGDGRLVRNGPWLHAPTHVVGLSADEQHLAGRILPLLHDGRFDPPWVRDIAGALTVPEDSVRQVLRKLLRRGEVLQVVRDLFYHADRVHELAALAARDGSGQGVSAAEFRDATGLGRKRAIQVLEFFDRLGYLRRVRDRHILRSADVFPGAAE